MSARVAAILLYGGIALGFAQDQGSHPIGHKPDFAPSGTVHISPAAEGNDGGDYSGPDYRSFRGFALPDLIAQIYGVNPIRIDFPSSIDTAKRYDVALVLPQPEDKEQVLERIRQGIQDYFHVVATREQRSMDVYVIAAPNGSPLKAETPAALDGAGTLRRSSSSQIKFEADPETMRKHAGSLLGIDALRGIAMTGSLEDFRTALEESLDHPVVNETNLGGAYVFDVSSSKSGPNDFLDHLRDQTGLLIRLEQRTVEIVAIRAR